MTEAMGEIVRACTAVYRKGAQIEERREGGIHVVEVWGMPHISEGRAEHPKWLFIDMEFLWVGVDPAAAEEQRAALVEGLKAYPEPDRLAGGPSYIEVAGVLGWEQEPVLQLFALGSALGLWEVISGRRFGFDEAKSRELAGRGFLMISGFR